MSGQFSHSLKVSFGFRPHSSEDDNGFVVRGVSVAERSDVPAQPAARDTEPEEPEEPLNLKAHAEDPDALEDALADSGRPRRRSRRAASRPAGAPSA